MAPGDMLLYFRMWGQQLIWKQLHRLITVMNLTVSGEQLLHAACMGKEFAVRCCISHLPDVSLKLFEKSAASGSDTDQYELMWDRTTFV